jgi:two-component system cell cycle sensor histidine kinase/response regulator CckA
VSLPNGPAPELESHTRQPSAHPTRHVHVLIVDDELIVRQTARALLEDLGLIVEEAVNGELAIAKLAAASTPFDVILLDASMPGLDAHATLRGLRALAPTLPILLCSGYSRNDFADELEGDGYLNFLAKPYRVKELSRMLVSMIDSTAS